MSKPELKQIIIDSLTHEKDSIIQYKHAVLNGIEDFDHPVLADAEIVPALEKVLDHYKKYAK